MKYGVYAIKDDLIGYANPFIETSEMTARRTFEHLVKNKNTAAGMNWKDCSIWHIGMYDDQSGELTSIHPKLVMTGAEVKAMEGEK